MAAVATSPSAAMSRGPPSRARPRSTALPPRSRRLGSSRAPPPRWRGQGPAPYIATMTDEILEAAQPALSGMALIKEEARRLPDRPGVYRMLGDDAEVLYVGKARSLKKRVMQYAQGRFHTNRIGAMVALTRSFVIVQTATETEALLLESNLIK